MNENYQDKTGSKLKATEGKLWLPPLSPKSQAKVKQLQRKPFAERMGFSGKTAWDLLQLLIIPVVLAVGGFLFTAYQHDADQQRALDQQQATTLQTYFDNVQDLLLNHNLLRTKPDDAVAILAEARTLATLQGLDPERKGRLLTFLHKAKLIDFDPIHGQPDDAIIHLDGADLSKSHLSNADLSNANLDGADLNSADLNGAYLDGADLNGAHLDGADLNGAHVYNTSFVVTDLSGADLSDTNLNSANFSGAHLDRVHLDRAYLWQADLHDAYLDDAYLDDAQLNGAQLMNAEILHTNLLHANLTGADLTGADLTGAYHLTQQQLDQVLTCKDATLPEGLICHYKQ